MRWKVKTQKYFKEGLEVRLSPHCIRALFIFFVDPLWILIAQNHWLTNRYTLKCLENSFDFIPGKNNIFFLSTF